jgi:hypothetical protein
VAEQEEAVLTVDLWDAPEIDILDRIWLGPQDLRAGFIRPPKGIPPWPAAVNMLDTPVKDRR